jgi:diacylglycerol O-acyltransferase
VEQLSRLEAGFLLAEDSDRHISLAIGGVVVIDGPIADYDALISTLGERLRAIPRFTQALRTHQFDVGAPEWVDDPGFDLAHHVRLAAVPHPGDDAALFRFVADIMERRLDRDRPLWECWIIEGLADNQWAMLLKIHHCIADGIATMHLLTCLCDDGDGDTFATEIHAGRKSRPRRQRLPVPSPNPLNWAAGVWHVSGAVTSAAVRAAAGAAEIVVGLVRPAAASSLTGPVTALRRYSAVRVSLDDVEHVCRTFDVTINDVALAAITESFRAILLRRGERPRRDSLRTLVPVSVRSADALDKSDNRVSVMLPYLPVELDDPIERLQTVHQRLATTKRSGQRQAGTMFLAATNYVPFALAAWVTRLLTSLPQRGVVTLATNVPGPRHRLRIMDHTVLRLLPVPAIALQLRTGIAMLTYVDDLIFGVTADYDTAPDIDDLVGGIEIGVARLVSLSRDPVGRRAKRSGLGD